MKKQAKEGIVFDSGMLKPEDQKCECGSEYEYTLVLYRRCKNLRNLDEQSKGITDIETLRIINEPFADCTDFEDLMEVKLEKGRRLINNIGIK